jgi:hypothetical protein
MEDRALRLAIRAKIENGRLPHDTIPRVWAGPGKGETCDGCNATIPKDENVMEAVGGKGDEVRFHVKCFYIWAAETCSFRVEEPAALDKGRVATRSESLLGRAQLAGHRSAGETLGA